MINSGERGFGLPKFSRAERERRWGRVRELMRRAGLDAVIGFPNQSHWDQFQADVRYLTQIGGHQTEAAMVFPEAGEVTAFVRGANEVECTADGAPDPVEEGEHTIPSELHDVPAVHRHQV